MMILRKRQTGSHGFTMIEVMIVLFLASVIFVIVFFAVPQLREASYTNRRTRDLSRLITELIAYTSANENTPPRDTVNNDLDDFKSNYIQNFTFVDPDTGNDYVITPVVDLSAPGSNDIGVIHYALGAVCDGSVLTDIDANPKDFALVMRSREGNITLCADNT